MTPEREKMLMGICACGRHWFRWDVRRFYESTSEGPRALLTVPPCMEEFSRLRPKFMENYRPTVQA